VQGFTTLTAYWMQPVADREPYYQRVGNGLSVVDQQREIIRPKLFQSSRKTPAL